MTEPRTDCPMHLPEAPPPFVANNAPRPEHVSTGSGGREADGSLTRRQRRRMEGLARVNGVHVPPITTHVDAERWINMQEARHRRASLRAHGDEL